MHLLFFPFVRPSFCPVSLCWDLPIQLCIHVFLVSPSLRLTSPRLSSSLVSSHLTSRTHTYIHSTPHSLVPLSSYIVSSKVYIRLCLALRYVLLSIIVIVTVWASVSSLLDPLSSPLCLPRVSRLYMSVFSFVHGVYLYLKYMSVYYSC